MKKKKKGANAQILKKTKKEKNIGKERDFRKEKDLKKKKKLVREEIFKKSIKKIE